MLLPRVVLISFSRTVPKFDVGLNLNLSLLCESYIMAEILPEMRRHMADVVIYTCLKSCPLLRTREGRFVPYFARGVGPDQLAGRDDPNYTEARVDLWGAGFTEQPPCSNFVHNGAPEGKKFGHCFTKARAEVEPLPPGTVL